MIGVLASVIGAMMTVVSIVLSVLLATAMGIQNAAARRLAVPDLEAAQALPEIRKRCPDSVLVSDIHFQYKFALMALDAGINKLRINPGNIGDAEKVRLVVRGIYARGKSLFFSLKLINRLLEPTEGEIFIAGRPSSSWNPIELRRGIGLPIAF